MSKQNELELRRRIQRLEEAVANIIETLADLLKAKLQIKRPSTGRPLN